MYPNEFVWEGVDWIDLAQNMKKSRDHVKAEINFLFSIKCGEFLEELIASQGLCFMGLV
jgi:hypothetical protein